MVILKGKFAFKTDIGSVRIKNEDRAIGLTDEKGRILLAVCDGMGGQNHGDLASKLAIDIITDEFNNRKGFVSDFSWLNKTVKKANSYIFNEALKHGEAYNGMGTTLTLIMFNKKNQMHVCQIGDSRCYLYKNDQLTQITEDQSYVGFLYRSGQIKKEEMLTHPKRHVILNALGIFPTISIDQTVRPYKGEQVLLCSDGLYNNVSEDELKMILRSSDTINQKVDSMISLANANGGSDNIGIAYWEID